MLTAANTLLIHQFSNSSFNQYFLCLFFFCQISLEFINCNIVIYSFFAFTTCTSTFCRIAVVSPYIHCSHAHHLENTKRKIEIYVIFSLLEQNKMGRRDKDKTYGSIVHTRFDVLRHCHCDNQKCQQFSFSLNVRNKYLIKLNVIVRFISFTLEMLYNARPYARFYRTLTSVYVCFVRKKRRQIIMCAHHLTK